ncbi:MAG: hypothetical protein KME29_13475 [Calothrix sp. FI2-JRJ7]|nr:hypothetical protein [Calothrix sp. FI2-JRJ7]
MRKFTQNTKLFRRWGLPLVGLALVLGIVTDRSKPVLSNQLDNDPYSYRVQLPDSGAYFETWKDQPSTVAQNVPNSEQSMVTAIVPEVETPRSKSTVRTSSNYPQRDGIYLYGQSPQPGQLGQGYVVFEKKQGRVVGALYMPDSEYSCFNGSVDEAGEIAMTVNPNASESGQTEVATDQEEPKLNTDEPTSYAYSIALRDFHQIDQMSKIDRDTLKKCQNQ